MLPGRLHGTVDGVFAVAITVLVFELPRPSDGADMGGQLLTAWPSYLAYAVSFATIGLIWIEHHAMASHLRVTDRRLLELTILFLAAVALIPWPTALVAGSLGPGGQARPAAMVFTATMLAMALTFSANWRYLQRHPEITLPGSSASLAAGARRSSRGALVYTATLALSAVSPRAALALCGAITIYFAASGHRMRPQSAR